jgi:hypothetical protein
VLEEYVDNYNDACPHRGLRLHTPNGQLDRVRATGAIRCRARLGGLLASTHACRARLPHEYLHPTIKIAAACKSCPGGVQFRRPGQVDLVARERCRYC